MIYAKIHKYNENQYCIISKTVQDDFTWNAYDVPDESWLFINNKTINVYKSNPNLENIKTNKKNQIRDKFEIDSNKEVLALNYKWNGGFDSAIKLDAAKRLSESAGLTSVVFFDLNNIPHTLSFTEALQVIIAVASSFQYQLGKKNSLFRLIETATSDLEVDVVTW